MYGGRIIESGNSHTGVCAPLKWTPVFVYQQPLVWIRITTSHQPQHFIH